MSKTETTEAVEGKEPKVKKEKDKSVLVGRVKKVIKKSRRKLSDEKFEKELMRTISFLEELQARMNKADQPSAQAKPAKKGGRKAAGDDSQAAVEAPASGNGTGKQSKARKTREKKDDGRKSKKSAGQAAT